MRKMDYAISFSWIVTWHTITCLMYWFLLFFSQESWTVPFLHKKDTDSQILIHSTMRLHIEFVHHCRGHHKDSMVTEVGLASLWPGWTQPCGVPMTVFIGSMHLVPLQGVLGWTDFRAQVWGGWVELEENDVSEENIVCPYGDSRYPARNPLIRLNIPFLTSPILKLTTLSFFLTLFCGQLIDVTCIQWLVVHEAWRQYNISVVLYILFVTRCVNDQNINLHWISQDNVTRKDTSS
jgi:hypothetical protein